MNKLVHLEDVIEVVRKCSVKEVTPAYMLIDKAEVMAELMMLPFAQPEPCVDTIDALNESIKHFDDLAEECRRNANIERNDYMDMRDDAAEYRQLSIWLNELKWLRERFQSQPEQQWIPVTERLPEKNVWVLVTFMMANGEVDTDIMRINRWDGGWDTHTFDMAYRETVIAWMPLPEPYGGEQE